MTDAALNERTAETPPVVAPPPTAAAPAAASPRAALIGWGIAIGSSLAFSFGTPIAKAIIQLGVDPTTLLLLRLGITTALLFGTLLFSEPRRLKMDRRGLGLCIGAGLANGVGMLSYFWSLTRLDASIASMIFSASPLVVLCLLALRGEKFTARNAVRLSLGLIGVYLLIGPGGNVDWVGVLLASASVFAVPLQLVIMQWYLGEYDSYAATLYMVVTMMALVFGLWLVEGAAWHNPSWQGWVLILIMAVVTTYLARILLFMSVRKIGGGQTGLLAPLETLFTVVWSILFLHEHLTLVQWLGGAVILSSAAVAVNRLGRGRWNRLPNFRGK